MGCTPNRFIYFSLCRRNLTVIQAESLHRIKPRVGENHSVITSYSIHYTKLYENTIGNTGDDRWILYRAGQGNGNLPSSNVLSLAMDHNGFIWIGTEDGMGVIQCPENIFSRNNFV